MAWRRCLVVAGLLGLGSGFNVHTMLPTRSPAARRVVSVASKSVPENLDTLTLQGLRDLASELGIRDPQGHKGRKRTWIDAIRTADEAAGGAGGAGGPISGESDTVVPAAAVGGLVLADYPEIHGVLASFAEDGSKGAAFLADLGVAAEEPREGASMTFTADTTDEKKRQLLGMVMDFLQQRMLGVGSVEDDPEHDVDFIAEGRRLLAVERFKVMPDAEEEKALVVQLVNEVAYLVTGGEGTGTLIMAPKCGDGDLENAVFTQVRVPPTFTEGMFTKSATPCWCFDLLDMSALHCIHRVLSFVPHHSPSVLCA